MTAAILIPSADGVVLAVDRRISYGSAHYDRAGSKVFSTPNLKLVAAGSLQRAQLLFHHLYSERIERGSFQPQTFFPEYFGNAEWDEDDDSSIQFLGIHKSQSFHVSGSGDVIWREPEEVWTIGSGGDYIKGYMAACFEDPIKWPLASVKLGLAAAFQQYPYNDVSHTIDVVTP